MIYKIQYKDDHECAFWNVDAVSKEAALITLCNTLNTTRLQTEQVMPSDFEIV